MRLREPTRVTVEPTESGGDSHRVTPVFVWKAGPVEITPVTDEQSEDFTEEAFEDALDKVSRTVQGKYADVMPSTEEFIRQRREEEVEVEDRQP